MKTQTSITMLCELIAMLCGLFVDNTNLILFAGFIMIGTMLFDYMEIHDEGEDK